MLVDFTYIAERQSSAQNIFATKISLLSKDLHKAKPCVQQQEVQRQILLFPPNTVVQCSVHSWGGRGTQCGEQSHAGQCGEVTSMANRLWPGPGSPRMQSDAEAFVAAENGKQEKRRGEDHRVAGNAPHPTLPFRSWAIPCGAPSPGFPLTPSQYAYSQEAAPTHSDCFLRFPPKSAPCSESAAIHLISCISLAGTSHPNWYFFYLEKVASEPKMQLFLPPLKATAPPIARLSTTSLLIDQN